MSAEFGEITLTKADLEAALKVLESGCTGQVTIVFSDVQAFGGARNLSDGFAIAPRAVHCLYGCKNAADIMAAMSSRKGIVREAC